MLTQEEWKIVRKALQCVQMAHSIVETAEGTLDRETPVDALIRKIRGFEDGLTQPEEDDKIEIPDCE